jgi:hypothetical protein
MTLPRMQLKRRRFVPFGDVCVVERALGIDAVDAVLFSGAAPLGHHDPAIAGRSIFRCGSG